MEAFANNEFIGVSRFYAEPAFKNRWFHCGKGETAVQTIVPAAVQKNKSLQIFHGNKKENNMIGKILNWHLL